MIEHTKIHTRRLPVAFTLLELLLVIAIMGVLVAMALPSAQPAVYDQLRSTARIVATDLGYARSLAISNNSSYTITFSLADNRYTLQHSGTNSALNKLPVGPFASPGDTTTKHIVELADLPHIGPTVRIAAVATSGSAVQSVGSIQFGPLGQTTQTDATVIWLAAGKGDAKRYLTLTVNPVTGIVTFGDLTKSGPASGITQVE